MRRHVTLLGLLLAALLSEGVLPSDAGATCAVLMDQQFYSPDTYYVAALTGPGSTIRGDFNWDGCSWSVNLELPQSGDVVSLTVDVMDLRQPGIYISFSDGKTFVARGYASYHQQGECQSPTEWVLVHDMGLSCQPAGVRAPSVGQVESAGQHAYPNPFSRATTIQVELESASNTGVTVYDSAGQRVRHLFEGELPSGLNGIPWDGLDDSGHRLAAGVYYSEVRTASGVSTRKLTLLQ